MSNEFYVIINCSKLIYEHVILILEIFSTASRIKWIMNYLLSHRLYITIFIFQIYYVFYNLILIVDVSVTKFIVVSGNFIFTNAFIIILLETFQQVSKTIHLLIKIQISSNRILKS